MATKRHQQPVTLRQSSRARLERARRTELSGRVLPRPLDRLIIGRGLSVSPFCLGRVTDWKLIPAAFEMGINFFFVSTDLHWPLYEASRKGLKALFASRKRVRDEVVIAGVCYPTQPEFMNLPFDELVNAVPRMTHVDILVAGGAYGGDLLARTATLRGVAESKRARAIGASFHDRQAVVWAANYQLIDLCFLRYSPAHPGAQYDLFPKLSARHPPLYNFNSMRGFVGAQKLRSMNHDPSLWHPEATDYYRYALSRPQVTGLLFSVTQHRQLTELEHALLKGPLTEAEEDHLEQLAVFVQRSSTTNQNATGRGQRSWAAGKCSSMRR